MTEELCLNCNTHGKYFQTGAEKYKLLVCFDAHLLQPAESTPNYKKQKKQEKHIKLEEIIRKVSALRNSGGGILFIHMRGISLENRHMSLFNEYVDMFFNSLIEDGRPFVTQYVKSWYSDSERYNEYQYLMVIVTGSNSVTTADYKTKVNLDDSVIRPTSHNMDRLLFDTKVRKHEATLLGLEPKEECRNVQFKSIQRGILAERNLQGIVDYIWNSLRLPEYITSFSKLLTGGSYYLGISEGRSGIQYPGIPFSEEQHKTFRVLMFDKVKGNIVTFSPTNRTFYLVDETTIQIEFYEVKGGTYVIEIAVGAAPGCLFYDTHGPETYVIGDNMSIRRLEFDEWLAKFETRNREIGLCPACEEKGIELSLQCQNQLCEDCRDAVIEHMKHLKLLK